MISFSRATEAERSVLDAALSTYASALADRLRLTRSRAVRDDLAWRRFVVNELRDRLRVE